MYVVAAGRRVCIMAKEKMQLHFQPSYPTSLIALLASPKFYI
jgi:hypothetical protein